MSARPFLWVVIGPNGSGKSTYYAYVVAPRLKAEFINADVIAQDRFGDEAEARSYEAARVAADRRGKLLADGTSFVFETVFSHPSKLEFLREAKSLGYQVWVSFLFVGSADLAVERVARRVREGGHSVPEQKTRERYQRMRALAVPALLEADRGFVIDNSSTAVPLRGVFQLDGGVICEREEHLPGWAVALIDVLQRYRAKAD